ncbi:MAG TPA: DUF4129 domain-containing protein [Candidatus Acidoferrales bacterium]|nr:DUF4129 domain-containing protein [Candidatus Acidoferrales bacterium]
MRRTVCGRWLIAALGLMVICGPLSVRAGAADSANSTAITPDSPKAIISLPNYEAELDRIALNVSVLKDHPERIGALRNSLPSGWTVQSGDQEFETSTTWLTDALKDFEKKSPIERKELCESAVRRLLAIRAEAENIRTAQAGPDMADSSARLQKILSAREFRQVHEQSWLSQLWDQVQRWIDWVLERTLGRLLGEGPLRTTLLYAMIAAVFLFVAVWIVRSLRSLARTETFRVDAVFPPGKHWRDWARESLTAAGTGDYRVALHAAYWAGVYRLAEVGAWQLDRARTPREYLRLVNQPAAGAGDTRSPAAKAKPEGAAALAALTRSMEASWYGYLPATQQDFDVAVNHLETLGCRLRSTAQTANS